MTSTTRSEKTVDLAGLAGTDLGSYTVAYDERDAILHALAVGAPADDLTLVYERDLRPLPTLLLGLGLWAVEGTGRLGAYDPTRSLHASQTLQVHHPLAPAARVEMRGRVAAVWDKGNSAVVEIEVSSDHATATYGIIVPGAGGFGGERGPSARRPELDDPPEGETTYRTAPTLAALYRLTGDRHPIHIDPQVAAAGGLDRPILHGLCTLAIAVREAAVTLDAHPADLRSLDARFTAPVLPGDELTTRLWTRPEGCAFVTTVADRPVVIGSGLRYTPWTGESTDG